MSKQRGSKEKEGTTNSVEQEAREVFARLDKNSDGNIEYGELKRGLKSLGLPVHNERDVRRMFDAMDLNKARPRPRPAPRSAADATAARARCCCPAPRRAGPIHGARLLM